MNIQQEISDVFSAFHDAVITKFEMVNQNCQLIIECQYLADMINSDYERFFLTLSNCSHILFEAWFNEAESKCIADITEIEKLELEIYDSEYIENKILVNCYFDYPSVNLSGGGVLSFESDGVTINDHDKQKISSNQFLEICDQFWKKRNKNK